MTLFSWLQEHAIEALKENCSTGVVTEDSHLEESESPNSRGLDTLQTDLQSNAAEMLLAEIDPGKAQLGDAVHGSPRAEQVPQPGVAQAIEGSAGAADIEAFSANSHSNKLSEGMKVADLDSVDFTAQTMQDGGMQHGSLADSRDINSKAVFKAVRQGSTLDLKRLLKAGCNVDVQDGDGRMALHFAAESK